MSTATYTALAFPVVFASAALATDIGWIASEQVRLQTATDATAMAAASHLNTLEDGDETTPDNYPQQVFLTGAAYSTVNWSTDPLRWEEFEIGDWDSTTKTWTIDYDDGEYVRVERTVRIPSMLGAAFGWDHYEIRAVTVARAIMEIRQMSYAYGWYACGIHADRTIDIDGGWVIDAYDGDAGPYNQLAARQTDRPILGAMCSNEDINANANAWQGWINALAGPGREPDGNSIDHVYGFTGAIETAPVFPSVTVPGFIIPTPPRGAQNTTTLTQSGAYYFPNGLSLTNQNKLKIPQGVQVELYVANGVNVSHEALINQGFDPAAVRIRVISGGVSFNDNSVVYADIYAPDSTITVNGGGNFYGGIVSDRITGNGNMAFHLDTSIAEDEGRMVAIEAAEEVVVVGTMLEQ